MQFLSYYRAMDTSLQNTVHVLEVGFGNLPSLRRVLSQVGVKVTPIENASEVLSARHLIIPGVGSFQTAMQHLEQSSFVESVQERCLQKKLPTLGICLGAQILLEEGHEGGINRGIGVFAGTVESSETQLSMPESHTGWDTVKINKSVLGFEAQTLADFFFNHDYIFVPKEPSDVYATANHGKSFPVILKKYNTFALQFHPEKSQASGLLMIRAFLRIDNV